MFFRLVLSESACVRSLLGMLGGAVLLALTGPADARMMSAAESRKLNPLLSQRPVDIYVATGPADACGPGCSEWIAIEGRFDADAGKRLQAFLNSPRRRSLPIFFHSPGGSLAAGIDMARILREHEMTAGVGRTTQSGCTVQRVAGGNCDRQVKSGEEVPSQFTFEGAQCHSACVFALAGALHRRIDPAALVGIHSPRADERAWKQFADQNPGVSRLTTEQRQQTLWRFMMALGVDPELVDLAERVNHNALYLLSRNEITRFGLESSDRFETRWLLRGYPDGSRNVTKAVTTADTEGGRTTSIVQVDCSNLFGYRLTVFHAIPKGKDGPFPPAQIIAGDTKLSLLAGAAKGVAYWTTVARDDEMQKIANHRDVEIRLAFSRGTESALALKMSGAGLAAGLSELQKHCSERKVKSAAENPSPD